MFERIADLTWKHPKAVLAAIGVFTVVAFALGGGVEERLKAAGFSDPASEVKRSQELLIERTGYDAGPWLVVLMEPRVGAPEPLQLGSRELRREVGRLAARLRSVEGVGHVENPLGGGSPQLIAPDRESLLLSGYLTSSDVDVAANAAQDAARLLTSRDLAVKVGGAAASFNEVNDTVRTDLIRAELIAFPLLALLLLIVFRGVVAASIPLLVGMVSVGGTFLMLRLMSEFVDTSIFALNIATALGLGLAVDYGLLLVTRYREELERHGPTVEAHRRLVESAGRTIVFSGLTVAAAMAALTLLPQRFLYSAGAGGALVSIFAAFGALLLVPSLLALLGERVNALSLRRGPAVSDASDRWYRLSRGVMRRPVGVALGSAAVLLLLAFPMLGVDLTTAGADSVPPGKPSRQVTERMDRDYPPGLVLPVTVTVNGPADDTRLRRLERQIVAIDGIAGPSRLRRLAPDLAVGNFRLRGRAGDALSDEAQQTVREIRRLEAPAPLLVAGFTAEFLDLKTSLRGNLPMVIGLIALSTLVLLFLLTGSVILPLKTLLMNVITLAATLGLIVAAFQWGILDGLLDYSGPAGMETSTLVLMFAVIFGLATDYAVLVLARIKELHDSGMSNEEAVAVLLDVTIVRALLVPALMRLFGDWNWWAPAPLRRIQRRFGLSEAS